MARKRGASGEFAEAVTLDDVLGVFATVEGPIATSGDVADALDCTTQTARRKLNQLREKGAIDSRVAGRTTVWWLTDAADEERAPAAALEGVTGLLDPEEADRFDERTTAIREEFDRELMGEN
jgi:predicted ArsR family transcriptional regulator